MPITCKHKLSRALYRNKTVFDIAVRTSANNVHIAFLVTPNCSKGHGTSFLLPDNHKSGADPEPPLPGGAQVTNEAEGFTEARSAERGRAGEGVTPSRRWWSGGPPPKIFLRNCIKMVHSECILR